VVIAGVVILVITGILAILFPAMSLYIIAIDIFVVLAIVLSIIF
jgi:hypothetical protein